MYSFHLVYDAATLGVFIVDDPFRNNNVSNLHYYKYIELFEVIELVRIDTIVVIVICSKICWIVETYLKK